jgi:hypothetical protein
MLFVKQYFKIEKKGKWQTWSGLSLVLKFDLIKRLQMVTCSFLYKTIYKIYLKTYQ